MDVSWVFPCGFVFICCYNPSNSFQPGTAVANAVLFLLLFFKIVLIVHKMHIGSLELGESIAERTISPIDHYFVFEFKSTLVDFLFQN